MQLEVALWQQVAVELPSLVVEGRHSSGVVVVVGHHMQAEGVAGHYKLRVLVGHHSLPGVVGAEEHQLYHFRAGTGILASDPDPEEIPWWLVQVCWAHSLLVSVT